VQRDDTKKQGHFQTQTEGDTIMKTLTAPAAYGFQELRQIHQRYMTIAMSTSITILLTLLMGYQSMQFIESDAGFPPPSKNPPIELGNWQPPLNAPREGSFIPIIQANIEKGIPIPIPDALVDPEKEFASQDQLAKLANQRNEEIGPFGDGERGIIPPEPFDPPPDTFIAYQIEPRVVLHPSPQYPDVALRIGVEGNVIVKALVNEEGRVKRAMQMRSTDEMFTQAAIDAAMKWTFTPALMNGHPVRVWVSIPFRFRLQN
jgi:TonB family protein